MSRSVGALAANPVPSQPRIVADSLDERAGETAAALAGRLGPALAGLNRRAVLGDVIGMAGQRLGRTGQRAFQLFEIVRMMDPAQRQQRVRGDASL